MVSPCGSSSRNSCLSVKKRGFCAAHDHDVEVAAPRRVGRQLPVEQVLHDRVGVVPHRVGQHEQSLARRAELVQRRRQHRILDDEAPEVGLDHALHRLVAVRLVDGLADVLPQLAVLDRPRALEVVDEDAVHDDLGQREQRVDPGVGRGRGADALARVELLARVAVEHLVAVEDAPDVAVAVHLEDVAVVAVHHQAPDGPVGVVLEGQDLAGIAPLLDQLLERAVDRELLQRGLVVDRQRVVHVEADGLDVRHPQVAIREDSLAFGDVEASGDAAEDRFERLRRELRIRYGHDFSL